MDNISPVGDKAIRVGFGTIISKKINRRVRQFCRLLQQNKITGLYEWVPSYTAVTIYYDSVMISYENIKDQLALLYMETLEELTPIESRVLFIPTCYDERFGYDLHTIREFHEITTEDIIHFHCDPYYLIYMLGFNPGFPYLGGMRREIATPRLANPRSLVEAGSVGIAGEQTGIYPINSPGGWQIIGRTPIKIFDIRREPPVIFEAGDFIKFYSISYDEFLQLEREIAENTYEVKVALYKDDEA